MDEFVNPVSLAHNAATMSSCLGIEAPLMSREALPWISSLLLKLLGGTAERALFFHPDAVAQWLYRKYPSYFTSVMENAPISVPFGTVMPSVTPVCFATMYTGALPETHGIREYRKPILQTDTLFDSLLRAGKRVANVASEGSSMSMIFSDRKMDSFILPDDSEVCAKALELLERDNYDFISVYCGDYDSRMHKKGTENEESLAVLAAETDIFASLAFAARSLWKDKRFLLTFQTDHGVHDLADGRGAHGTDATDDLNILHFFGAYPSDRL